ncbi:ABC transporter ATP-binding protein [bacterium]|nr:ABC transporter ATP-binding protein [bacterium]
MSDTLEKPAKTAPQGERPDMKSPPGEKRVMEAIGLGCRFGRRWVVRGLDLAVPEGSVTALLGRNGVGKSTTIQMLLGLLPASEGTVSVLGLDPRRRRAEMFSRLGYVSERRELLEERTVSGLARIVAAVHGERFDRDGFEALRARYKLESGSRCSTLSKGQRARLLLSLALMAKPEVLVLDEPTSGLDVVVRDDFLEAIASFVAEEGRAVLLSTHLIEDVARICDRAVIMREGAAALSGEIESLRASVSRYVVRLTGVLPESGPLGLPRGVVVVERDPRAITVVAQGAPEHFEAALEAALPVEGIERRPATLKETFTCLTEPCTQPGPGSEARA